MATRAILSNFTDETSLDSETGAVTSKQSAEIALPRIEVDRVWDPEHLERVARTYWSTMQRFSLGLLRVHYSGEERAVVLLPRFRLLTFRAPEYEMDRCRGIVRWRIARGMLVSKLGRDGDGYLEIDIQRHDLPDRDEVRLEVVVEVANYYPSLTGISRWIYAQTQSRIHVLACNFFLRRLVSRELSVSRVGHFAGPRTPAQTPDPVAVREK